MVLKSSSPTFSMHRYWPHLTILALLVGLFVGSTFSHLFNPYYTTTKTTDVNYPYRVPTEGFTKVTISTDAGTKLFLKGDCQQIFFDVTPDQIYSIRNAMGIAEIQRPLSHDLTKSILENFDIDLIHARVDSGNSSIYTARLFLKQNNKILEIDARPSDTIAIALRFGVPLYVKNEVLRNGESIC